MACPSALQPPDCASRAVANALILCAACRLLPAHSLPALQLPDGAWEAAAEALSAAWAEVDEDLHREEARLAAGFPMPR